MILYIFWHHPTVQQLIILESSVIALHYSVSIIVFVGGQRSSAKNKARLAPTPLIPQITSKSLRKFMVLKFFQIDLEVTSEVFFRFVVYDQIFKWIVLHPS